MTAMPSFIAKEAVRRECCEISGRSAISFAISVLTFWALMLGDQPFLGTVFGAVALVFAGMVVGALLIERKVS